MILCDKLLFTGFFSDLSYTYVTLRDSCTIMVIIFITTRYSRLLKLKRSDTPKLVATSATPK